MGSPVWMTASELVGLYRRRALSPVDVIEAVLARIDEFNPTLNAFCLVDHEAARAAARRSEERWRRMEPIGLLDGVPVSIKDLILTEGWPTRRGSRAIDPKQDWRDDAPVTARLRAHGAVLLGKTTTPEFGWKGVTDSPLTGITRNPWRLDRTPGGSSGGAGAQVAAGLGPLAIGTDGGGSIRIPAAFCGVVGLKPSFGRVPAWPMSPFGTLAHLGPMTRSVEDAALMLTVMAEPDPRDWYALPYDGRDWREGLEGGVAGLKIAYSPRLGYAQVDPEIAAAVATAAAKMAALGAHVEELDPGFPDPMEIYWTLWSVGAWNALAPVEARRRRVMERGLLALAAAGGRVGLKRYMAMTNARQALGGEMRVFHTRYDVLMTPTLAVSAFPVERIAPDPGEDALWPNWTPFSYPFNLTQQPAITVPCGLTAEGLPTGVQFVGPLHGEDIVLRAARAFESADPFVRRQRPPL